MINSYNRWLISYIIQILANFKERLQRQSEDAASRMLLIDEGEFDLTPQPEVDSEDDLWNFQLFRSITLDSVIFDFDKKDKLHTRYLSMFAVSVYVVDVYVHRWLCCVMCV